MSQEYAMGWRRAALWANRDDLIADIESPAYERDMATDLATLRQPAARADDERVGLALDAYNAASGNQFDAMRAALSAQPAPERQGEAVAWIDEFGNVYPLGAHSLAGKLSWQDAHKRNWRPLYLHPAAPVGVPDALAFGDVMPNGTRANLDSAEGWNACREAMLAAAPSAPQGTQQGVG